MATRKISYLQISNTGSSNGQVLTSNGSAVVWGAGGGGGGGGASVTVSATAPSSPTAGNLWWNSELGALFIYYTDADGSQWVAASSNMSGVIGSSGISIGKSIVLGMIFGG